MTKAAYFPDIDSLSLTEQNVEILSFLIQDENDFSLFMDKFWNQSPNELIAVSNFRLHKRKEFPIPYHLFKFTFACEPHKALEQLFQQRVSQDDVIRLIRNISDDIMSLKDLYDESMKDPHLKLARFLHDRRRTKRMQQELQKRL